jgi:tRNA pseudouridine55 synthase
VTTARETSLTGVLVMDKPKGPSSFDVIRAIRRLLGIKKIGHIGTLDPMATGVLPLAIGRATRLVPFIQDGPKEYEGRMLLGRVTDTLDVTGRVLEESPVNGLTRQDIESAAGELVGDIQQVPPAYSAVKINGRPAYKLARKGEDVLLKSRTVTVHSFRITDAALPLVDFSVLVSKGTYVRTLVSDLGARLGVGGCLERLRRLKSGPFSITQAVTLEEAEALAAEERLSDRIISANEALEFLPQVSVSSQTAEHVANGRSLDLQNLEATDFNAGPVRVRFGDGLLAVYEYNPSRDPERLIPLRVLGVN